MSSQNRVRKLVDLYRVPKRRLLSASGRGKGRRFWRPLRPRCAFGGRERAAAVALPFVTGAHRVSGGFAARGRAAVAPSPPPHVNVACQQPRLWLRNFSRAPLLEITAYDIRPQVMWSRAAAPPPSGSGGGSERKRRVCGAIPSPPSPSPPASKPDSRREGKVGRAAAALRAAPGHAALVPNGQRAHNSP